MSFYRSGRSGRIMEKRAFSIFKIKKDLLHFWFDNVVNQTVFLEPNLENTIASFLPEEEIVVKENPTYKSVQYNQDGNAHKENGPAHVSYTVNKIFELWFEHGSITKQVVKDSDGNLLATYFFDKLEYHRLDGPAVIDYRTDQREWWINGVWIDTVHTNSDQLDYPRSNNLEN